MDKNGKHVRSFEDLEVWNFCRQLRKKIEQLVKTFPVEDDFRKEISELMA